ncbi:hypothetical protein X732_26145 [Mesorhizobium sp. L2C066B000]|nr:hypothetical protein X732_26145 [Mesorhizobium sp. L2C066B000]ESZ53243.1 hypothetical protein X731_00505 [Mesorhizobium sp. L2C054A000]
MVVMVSMAITETVAKSLLHRYLKGIETVAWQK